VAGMGKEKWVRYVAGMGKEKWVRYVAGMGKEKWITGFSWEEPEVKR